MSIVKSLAQFIRVIWQPCYQHLNDGFCFLGNDDIVLKKEQCEELLAKRIVWLF